MDGKEALIERNWRRSDINPKRKNRGKATVKGVSNGKRIEG